MSAPISDDLAGFTAAVEATDSAPASVSTAQLDELRSFCQCLTFRASQVTETGNGSSSRFGDGSCREHSR
jgi:hypothetical protein